MPHSASSLDPNSRPHSRHPLLQELRVAAGSPHHALLHVLGLPAGCPHHAVRVVAWVVHRPALHGRVVPGVVVHGRAHAVVHGVRVLHGVHVRVGRVAPVHGRAGLVHVRGVGLAAAVRRVLHVRRRRHAVRWRRPLGRQHHGTAAAAQRHGRGTHHVVRRRPTLRGPLLLLLRRRGLAHASGWGAASTVRVHQAAAVGTRGGLLLLRGCWGLAVRPRRSNARRRAVLHAWVALEARVSLDAWVALQAGVLVQAGVARQAA